MSNNKMHQYSEELIGKTITVFQPHFERELMEEDACAIIEQWASFLKVLEKSLNLPSISTQSPEDIFKV